MLPELADDGCTGFLNGWGGVDWRMCCEAHDWAFHTGITWQDWLVANFDLWRCIAERDIFAATIVALAVTVGSAPLFIWGVKKWHKQKSQ